MKTFDPKMEDQIKLFNIALHREMDEQNIDPYRIKVYYGILNDKKKQKKAMYDYSWSAALFSTSANEKVVINTCVSQTENFHPDNTGTIREIIEFWKRWDTDMQFKFKGK